MQVKLSNMPDPKTVNTITLSNLYGGLNLKDDPRNVGSSQSPDMMNLWYRDGVLRKRHGLEEVFAGEAEDRAGGQVFLYDRLFHGLMVYLDGNSIRYFDPAAETPERKTVSGTNIPADAMHGSFFPFDECLYYKARGVYLRLKYNAGTLTAENILWKSGSGYQVGSVYRPVIAINRSADGTRGDSYQPENRINPEKEVWFDTDRESYDYYLPVNGCTVLSVRLGDDEITLNEAASPGGTYFLNGHQMTVNNQQDGSALKTYLHFSEPLYIDETGWDAKDWSQTESNGWNYLPNVIYSNFPISATENTSFKNGKILKYANATGVPADMTMTFLQQALNLCPYTFNRDDPEYFVLDNGKWMNVFILGYVGAEEGDDSDSVLNESPNLVSYNSSTTEMVLKNYYLVSYCYETGQWSGKDFSGKTDSGWHYAKNCVYSTVDIIGSYSMTPSGGETIEYAIQSGAGPKYSVYPLSHSDLLSIAETACGGTSATRKLLWTSANDTIWTFHFLMNGNKFYVTKYDAGKDWFQGYGVRMVTIQKSDPLHPTVEDMTEPGQWGFYVKNILWSSENIVYNTYVPGDAIVKKSENALPEIYKKYVETALYRARRDYPNVNFTGKYAVAVKDPYITVYLDAGMELMSYDLSNGEFTATGWVSESYTMDDAYMDLELGLYSPEAMSNQLRVVYSKANPDAMKSIADGEIAVGFGGTDAICVVIGGCDAQPNAIFWSGNGSAGIDATYFPMDQYNLCGAYQDAITGFGKQQSVLIVFQSHHTAKASYGITETGGRKYIDLTLSTINAEKGCDRPWSICLCGNNLAWVHSRHGVMYLRDTSSAYENQIVVISENINGCAERKGLMEDLKNADVYTCVGAEDGQKYYLAVGGKLYVWDYSLSTVGGGIDSLSWSRHTFVPAQSAAEGDTGTLWLLEKSGRVSRMKEGLDTDFGETIRCHYRTPTMNFGGYYRKRTVEKVIISVGRERTEPITVFYGGEGLTLRHPETGKVMERTDGDFLPMVLRPRGLRLHHFFLQIESDGPLSIAELLILYTSQGKTK